MRSTPTLRILLVLAGTALLAGACATDYGVERRETPVHVWLAAPGADQGERVYDALIYVGAEKVIEGSVRFGPDVGYVALPTVYVTAGKKTVSAVVRGGAASATAELTISAEHWIVVTIHGREVSISQSKFEPATR